MQPISFKHIRQVVNLSLPMAGSRFLQMLSGFIGMMMLAHLGREVLAACALINAALTTVLLIFISIIFSVSFIVSQVYGAKEYSTIGLLIQESLALSLALSFFMLIIFWFVDDVLLWFHQSPMMVHYVRQYFHALMWGVVPILLQTCMQQFFYGILKQKLVIMVDCILLLLGVPIAYMLIFGRLGFEAQGVAGLAHTFAIQSFLGFFILLGICFFSRDFQRFFLFKWHAHHRWVYFRQVFQVGWPMSVQFGGELLAFFVVTMMIGWLGTNALAAVQVTQQWMFLVVVPIFAMSESAGILVGQAVGAKQYGELRAIGYSSLIVSVGLVICIDFAFLLFPHFFASFYLNSADAANQAILHTIDVLFVILTVTLIVDALRDVTSGLLRGLFDTRFPMHIGIVVMWCLVLPLGYLMAFSLKWGIIGFKIGGTIGLLIGAVIIYWRWISKLRRFV